MTLDSSAILAPAAGSTTATSSGTSSGRSTGTGRNLRAKTERRKVDLLDVMEAPERRISQEFSGRNHGTTFFGRCLFGGNKNKKDALAVEDLPSPSSSEAKAETA